MRITGITDVELKNIFLQRFNSDIETGANFKKFLYAV